VDILRTREKRGSSDADDRTFGENIFAFFKIYCLSVQTREEEVSQYGHFRTNGRGLIFRDFVRTSIIDGLLRKILLLLLLLQTKP